MVIKLFKRLVCCLTLAAFVSAGLPSYAQRVLPLPAAGSMALPASSFVPAILKGMKVYPREPLRFDFVIDTGNSALNSDDLKPEVNKIIRYFLASLTTPEKDLWVNLSPHEGDRIIPDAFGQTEMGRDLLLEDYILKQLTSSLMHPESPLGKEIWKKIYAVAFQKYGIADVPLDTFNKVWITPDEATVYVKGTTAVIKSSHLKVMLESDYIAESMEQGAGSFKQDYFASTAVAWASSSNIAKDVLREVIIPVLEKEVNQGSDFAVLRQIYSAMVLATWFKRNMQKSLVGEVYADRNKVRGIDLVDKDTKEQVWRQYVEALKKGAFNYIKEEFDEFSGEVIPRKYFAGGFADRAEAVRVVPATVVEMSGVVQGDGAMVVARADLAVQGRPDASQDTVAASAGGYSYTQNQSYQRLKRTSPQISGQAAFSIIEIAQGKKQAHQAAAEMYFGLNAGTLEHVRSNQVYVFRHKYTGRYYKAFNFISAEVQVKRTVANFKRYLEFLSRHAGKFIMRTEIFDEKGRLGIVQDPADVHAYDLRTLREENALYDEDKPGDVIWQESDDVPLGRALAQNPFIEPVDFNRLLHVEVDREGNNIGLVYDDTTGRVKAYVFDFDGKYEEDFRDYEASAIDILSRAPAMEGVPLTDFSPGIQAAILKAHKERMKFDRAMSQSAGVAGAGEDSYTQNPLYLELKRTAPKGFLTRIFSDEEIAQGRKQAHETAAERYFGAEKGELEFIRKGNWHVFRSRKTGIYFKAVDYMGNEDDVRQDLLGIRRQIEFMMKHAYRFMMSSYLVDHDGRFWMKQVPADVHAEDLQRKLSDRQGLLLTASVGWQASDDLVLKRVLSQNPFVAGSSANRLLNVETSLRGKNFGLVYDQNTAMVRAYVFDFEGKDEADFVRDEAGAIEILKSAPDMEGVPLQDFSPGVQAAILKAHEERMKFDRAMSQLSDVAEAGEHSYAEHPLYQAIMHTMPADKNFSAVEISQGRKQAHVAAAEKYFFLGPGSLDHVRTNDMLFSCFVFRHRLTGRYYKGYTLGLREGRAKGQVKQIKLVVDFLNLNARRFIMPAQTVDRDGQFFIIQEPADVHAWDLRINLLATGAEPVWKETDQQTLESLVRQNPFVDPGRKKDFFDLESSSKYGNNIGLVYDSATNRVRAYIFDFGYIEEDFFRSHEAEVSQALRQAPDMEGVPLTDFSPGVQAAILKAHEERMKIPQAAPSPVELSGDFDQAQKTKDVGGIDLNSRAFRLSETGGQIDLGTAVADRLNQRIEGFVPVVFSITPLHDPQAFFTSAGP
jgi:hypothetical protein